MKVTALEKEGLTVARAFPDAIAEKNLVQATKHLRGSIRSGDLRSRLDVPPSSLRASVWRDIIKAKPVEELI